MTGSVDGNKKSRRNYKDKNKKHKNNPSPETTNEVTKGDRDRQMGGRGARPPQHPPGFDVGGVDSPGETFTKKPVAPPPGFAQKATKPPPGFQPLYS